MNRKSGSLTAVEIINRKALHQAYKEHLAETGKEHSLLEAEVFSVKCHNEGMMYGLSERGIILALAGKLPFMYD